MASTKSHNHANLIREMSRDITGDSRSSSRSASSVDKLSATSDFDPENEAIMSTKRVDDYVQRLPPLPTNTHNYSRFAPKQGYAEPVPEQDFAIDTSAIDRAFPDFSQGPSSEDDSMSIEIGRGVQAEHKGSAEADLQLDQSILDAQHHPESSLEFTLPTIDGYQVTRTPPLNSKPTRISSHSRGQGGQRRASNLRNEVSVPATKSKDCGSSDSAKGSGEHGPSLAAMHARVREENDLSYADYAKQSTVGLNVKSTRFGQAKEQKKRVLSGHLPTRFSSSHGLRSAKLPKNEQQPDDKDGLQQVTQQSFAIPDMPNISELISGVFEDGTPVFSRHGKSRPSRADQRSHKKPTFAAVEEIPVPEEEQAIFLSLKLLQDKVSVLERNNAEAQTTIEDLQQQNAQLQTERSTKRQSSRRADSALGSTDSEGGDEMNSQRKFTIEKDREFARLSRGQCCQC